MDGSESSRSRSKREVEEKAEARDSSRVEDGEDSDKRKHRSSKSRKHGGQEEGEEQDSGRRKSSGERTDTRRKSGGSSRAGSGDEDDCEVRRESRSKMPRKSLEERGEMRLSDGNRDRDSESSRKNRDNERDLDSSRKTSAKPSSGGHEGSQGKSRSKEESSHGRDIEKGQDRDSRYSDRKESSSKEKDYGQQDQEKNNTKRRSDEVDTSRRAEESSHGDKRASDNKVNSRERTSDIRNESAEDRSRVLDSSVEKGGRSDNKDRTDRERHHGRSDAQNEYNRGINTPREVRDDKQSRLRERSEDLEPSSHPYVSKSYGDKVDKSRCDEFESRERSVNVDEDRHGRLRDRNEREARPIRMSQTPERSGRHHKEMDGHDRGVSESDSERSISTKGKERDLWSLRPSCRRLRLWHFGPRP